MFVKWVVLKGFLCPFPDRRLKEFGHLLEDYTEAWHCVRESLEAYGKI